MKIIQLIFLLTTIVFINSCGYIDDKPKENVISTGSALSSCRVDVEKFKKILKEDVGDQIACIKKNLENFSKYSNRQDKSHIKKSALNEFINKFFKSNSKSIINSLDLLLELNQLFYNDKDGNLQVQNITPLFNSLATFNENAIKISKSYNDYQSGKVSFIQTSKKIEQAASSLSSGILKSVQQTRSNNRKQEIDLKLLLQNLAKSSLADTKIFSTEGIDLILLLKTLLVGGDRNIITNNELVNFLHKFPKLFVTAFNLLESETKDFETSITHSKYKSDNIKELYSLLIIQPTKKSILTQNEIFKYIDSFVDDDKKSDLYKEVLTQAKLKLINKENDKSDNYNYYQLIALLDYSRLFLLVNNTYDFIKDDLNEVKLNVSQKKQKVLNTINTLAINLNSILIEDNGRIKNNIQLYSFIKMVNRKIDNKIDEKIIEGIFNLKRPLVGGNKKNLTKLELKSLILKLPILGEISERLIEVTKDSSKKLFNKIDVISLFRKALTNSDQVVLTVKELLQTLSLMLINEPVEKYGHTVQIFKSKLIGGNSTSFTSAELDKTLSIVGDLQKNLLYQNIQYINNTELLKSEKKIMINEHKITDHVLLSKYSKIEKKILRKEYLLNMKHFIYFRSPETGTQSWSHSIKRNREGYLEVTMIKWIYDKIISIYSADKTGLNITEIDTVLHVFKPMLEAHQLWSKYIKTFGRNMLLLSDLFQSMANGNLKMDAYEATEYSILAISAMKMTDKMLKNYISENDNGEVLCKNLGTEKEIKVSVHCYRTYFFESLFKTYSSQLPKLKAYVDGIRKTESYTFVEKIEGFARDTHDNKIPVGSSDLIRILGAMLNIESTFVRFDLNHNNLLDPEELDVAFNVYENGIIKVANLDGIMTKFAKPIYFFMIEEMKIPTKLELIKYTLNPFKEIPTAKRLNIGVLLYYLVNGPPEEKVTKSHFDQIFDKNNFNSKQYNQFFDI